MNQPPYNPYEQPGNFAPPPPMAPPPPQRPLPHKRFISWYRQQARPMQIIVALGLIAAVIFVGSAVISGAVQGVQQGLATPTVATVPTQASQATTAPTTVPTVAPTKAPAYPPKTLADLKALAALGDASQIHEFHSESVGLTGACPEPKRLVTVASNLTGRKLAEDLLAYYYSNGIENPCGGVVFAFHKQSEGNGDNGYTAGRILLKTTDANGGVNLDPNATGIKYTLTLDTGDSLSAQDYDVTWQQ